MDNDQELKREFGRRLQAERERLGLSVAEFADRVGCAQRCQSDFEQGVLWPYADYVQKAVGLGLDASVLFGVSEPEPQNTGGHSMPEVQESVKNMLALMGKQTDSNFATEMPFFNRSRCATNGACAGKGLARWLHGNEKVPEWDTCRGAL